MKLHTRYGLEKVSGNLKDNSDYRIGSRSGQLTVIDSLIQNNQIATLKLMSSPFAPNPVHSFRLRSEELGKYLIVVLRLFPRLGIGIGYFNTTEQEQVLALLTKDSLELFIFKHYIPPKEDRNFLWDEPYSRYRRKDKRLLAEIHKLRENATGINNSVK